eukprot:8964808-Alexandrium_andersonii.AAC.1
MLRAAGPATHPPLGLVVLLECALARAAHDPRQLAESTLARTHDPRRTRFAAPPRPPVAAGAGSGP